MPDIATTSASRTTTMSPRHVSGGTAVNAAIKAQTVYANYIDKLEQSRLALFEEAAAWADERRAAAPNDANAHYLYAFALGRYSQGISVAKALPQGFGGKIKDALNKALKLAPKLNVLPWPTTLSTPSVPPI